jgi:hypothetical protein
MQRPLCAICGSYLAAINYVKNDQYHYRKSCEACMRKGKKLKPKPPAWFKTGYRKKNVCEKCGYRAKYPEKQITVFHIDGNLRNNLNVNLKSICLNCRVEIAQSRLPWRESPITPDF